MVQRLADQSFSLLRSDASIEPLLEFLLIDTSPVECIGETTGELTCLPLYPRFPDIFKGVDYTFNVDIISVAHW